jgi:DNA-binding NtrC family response regulator
MTSSARTARAIGRLIRCNPFSPERIVLEREILGTLPRHPVWSYRGEPDSPSLAGIARVAERILPGLRDPGDVALYLLYDRFRTRFDAVRNDRAPFYDDFFRESARLPAPESRSDPSHLFAFFFQVRRAFRAIYERIVGASPAAARLRAAAWQSIFTRDLDRYRRSLYRSLGDLATLIVGESGTGKEIVARAVGLSAYRPFDPATRTFAPASFDALNLSALPSTLVESELFGHRRGAFTGAAADRAGWLELCRPCGAVFLDEIGELEPAIQVKLLRVLQNREFQRLGDSSTRRFQGKIIAATNRDLAAELDAGRFRRDLYYRLCSDTILMPTLREQISNSPDELAHLVEFVSRRVCPDESEKLARETVAWISRRLGRDYAWPGNFRELEQCVRNILVRGEYHPPRPSSPSFARSILDGRFTADELLRRYCTLVYSRTHSYEEAARRLGLDRRTVRSKVDPDLLAGMR